VNGNKNSKVPKDKYNSTHREVSSSPSSGMSGSLTPGGVALSSSSSINGPMASMIADMDSRESMSPLSSDTNTTSTPLRFDRSNRNINNDLNDRLVSDDSDSDESPKRNKNSNKKSHSRDSSQISKNQTESSKVQQTNKRKRDSKELSDQSKIVSRNVSSLSPAHETSLNFQEYDSVFLTDLIDLQKRISESTNTDLLQRIVDTIEESGLFNITNSTFDFDLMKLDKNTIRKIKTFFIS
jgi:YEATS domain-containing protein 1/3